MNNFSFLFDSRGEDHMHEYYHNLIYYYVESIIFEKCDIMVE
jgi:hypothetical protein